MNEKKIELVKYNVCWREHRNAILEAKNRKEAMTLAAKLIFKGKLKGSVNGVYDIQLSTKYYMLHCKDCGQNHWTTRKCKKCSK